MVSGHAGKTQFSFIDLWLYFKGRHVHTVQSPGFLLRIPARCHWHVSWLGLALAFPCRLKSCFDWLRRTIEPLVEVNALVLPPRPSQRAQLRARGGAVVVCEYSCADVPVLLSQSTGFVKVLHLFAGVMEYF